MWFFDFVLSCNIQLWVFFFFNLNNKNQRTPILKKIKKLKKIFASSEFSKNIQKTHKFPQNQQQNSGKCRVKFFDQLVLHIFKNLCSQGSYSWPLPTDSFFKKGENHPTWFQPSSSIWSYQPTSIISHPNEYMYAILCTFQKYPKKIMNMSKVSGFRVSSEYVHPKNIMNMSKH